jgi:3',5'-cyclic-AMP phosphodiesterase
MPIVDITTVSDTQAVVHVKPDTGPVRIHRFDGLAPASNHELRISDDTTEMQTVEVRTLPTPPGELRCVFATVNDVHFGETVAGQVDNLEMGPLRRSAPGDEPYPEVMNAAAAGEMVALDPSAVMVKGDLSLDGTPDEWAAFEHCYRTRFRNRLHVVRGNHDSYRFQTEYSGDQRIDLDGITIALLDTAIPGATTGDISVEQAEWLDGLASGADQPVMVMGHHQQWIADPSSPPHEGKRSDDYFGLHPDGSDRLDDVSARRPSIIAYSAGHTHRHRVRTMTQSRIPSIEVGCVKDFPGTWAEHRVYDGGVMQIVHRISSPAALEWSEQCRNLYEDFDIDYQSYALGGLHDRCFVIPFRSPAG